MVELTQLQMQTLERLFAAGFRPIAIPPYESALCVHRGECAAVLAPVENGGLRLLAPATLMVDGNLSVRLKRAAGDVFVWKKKEVAATPERLKELEAFRAELVGILEMAGSSESWSFKLSVLGFGERNPLRIRVQSQYLASTWRKHRIATVLQVRSPSEVLCSRGGGYRLEMLVYGLKVLL